MNGTLGWAYIAGFFDGEGTVDLRCGGKTHPMARVSQSGEVGRWLLVEMQEFLRGDGVESGGPYVKRIRGYKDSYTIQIMRRDSVKRFFLCILPFLRIKKVVVQDSLRFMVLFPNPKRGLGYTFIVCKRGHSLAERKQPEPGGRWEKCKQCQRLREQMRRRTRSEREYHQWRVESKGKEKSRLVPSGTTAEEFQVVSTGVRGIPPQCESEEAKTSSRYFPWMESKAARQ